MLVLNIMFKKGMLFDQVIVLCIQVTLCIFLNQVEKCSILCGLRQQKTKQMILFSCDSSASCSRPRPLPCPWPCSCFSTTHLYSPLTPPKNFDGSGTWEKREVTRETIAFPEKRHCKAQKSTKLRRELPCHWLLHSWSQSLGAAIFYQRSRVNNSKEMYFFLKTFQQNIPFDVHFSSCVQISMPSARK